MSLASRVRLVDGLWRAYLATLRAGSLEQQRAARQAWELAS